MNYKTTLPDNINIDKTNILVPYIDALYFLSLCLMIVSFPFTIALNSIATGALIGLFLLDYKNLSARINIYFKNSRNILLLIIFCSLLISITYSGNKQAAIAEIIKFLPLISLPLALTKTENFSGTKINTLKNLHIAVCFMAALICLILAVKDSGLLTGAYKLHTAPENHAAYIVYRLTYHNLSGHLNIHAIYFSLFICVAVFFIITELKHNSRAKKAILVLLLIFFILFLILLKASVLNLAFYIVLSGYIFVHFTFRKWHEYLLFFSLIIFATFVVFYLFTLKNGGEAGQGIYFFNDPAVNKNLLIAIAATVSICLAAVITKLVFKKRHILLLTVLASLAVLTGIIAKINDPGNLKVQTGTATTNVNARLQSWVADWMIVKEYPLTGVGTGSEEEALTKKYQEMGFTAGVDNRFDAHNQYFQFWISSGILSFLCFFLLLASQLYKAIRSRNFILLGFTFCYASLCITESVMNAQVGRTFFLFFICLSGNAYFSARNISPVKL